MNLDGIHGIWLQIKWERNSAASRRSTWKASGRRRCKQRRAQAGAHLSTGGHCTRHQANGMVGDGKGVQWLIMTRRHGDQWGAAQLCDDVDLSLHLGSFKIFPVLSLYLLSSSHVPLEFDVFLSFHGAAAFPTRFPTSIQFPQFFVKLVSPCFLKPFIRGSHRWLSGRRSKEKQNWRYQREIWQRAMERHSCRSSLRTVPSESFLFASCLHFGSASRNSE